MKKTLLFLLLAPMIIISQTIEKRTYYQSQKINESYSVLEDNKDIKHGRYTKYYSSGSKQKEGNIVNGKKAGWWTEYYPGCKLRAKGEYSEGEKVDLWYYYTNGKKSNNLSKIINHTTGKLHPLTLDSFPLLNFLNITYPAMAKEMKLEGSLEISFQVDSTCACSSLKIINSTHPILNNSALEGAKRLIKWIENNDKLECDNREISIPLEFKLH